MTQQTLPAPVQQTPRKGRFGGQVAWITGGGTGIGRSLALELARQGADVAVSGRRQDRLDGVVAELEALGARGLAVVCDVTDEASVEGAVAAVVRDLGGIDVAIANAGLGVMGRFEDLDLDAWRLQMDVNVIGLVATARHALPHLRARGGRLVLIGSVAALMAGAGGVAYNASKFAVRAIGLTLSQELHGSGVSCTTIHPGFVESEINQVDNTGTFDATRTDQRPQRIMWTGERAARVVVRAVHKRKREFVFTGHGKLGAFLGKHFPSVVQFVLTRAAAKRRVSQMTVAKQG